MRLDSVEDGGVKEPLIVSLENGRVCFSLFNVSEYTPKYR